MKKSKDWLSKDGLVKKIAAWFAEQDPAEAEWKSRNEIAEEIGVEANGKFYQAFAICRAERNAEMSLPALDLPDERKAEFKKALTAWQEDATNIFVRTVRSIASDVDHSSALRVQDAERRAKIAENEQLEVLSRLVETEEDREEALAECDRLREVVSDLERTVARLEGRLEERAHASASRAEADHMPTQTEEAESFAGDDGAGRENDAKASAQADGAESPAPSTASRQASATSGAATKKSDQPSTNEEGGPQVHQSELSLGSDASTSKAEVDDAENG